MVKKIVFNYENILKKKNYVIYIPTQTNAAEWSTCLIHCEQNELLYKPLPSIPNQALRMNKVDFCFKNLFTLIPHQNCFINLSRLFQTKRRWAIWLAA